MTKRDYYEILGVSKNADEAEIKKAYRQMALKYHPDKNPGDHASEEKFKEAAEAYDVLSNPDKKSRYDRFGHQGVNGQQGFSGGGMSMDDIFSHFGDIFGGGDPFSSFFGGSADDQLSAFAVDPCGNLAIGGSTRSTDFPLFLSKQSLTNSESFVSVFDTTGRVLVFSTKWGSAFISKMIF